MPALFREMDGAAMLFLMLRHERKWGDGKIIDETEKGTGIHLGKTL